MSWTGWSSAAKPRTGYPSNLVKMDTHHFIVANAKPKKSALFEFKYEIYDINKNKWKSFKIKTTENIPSPSKICYNPTLKRIYFTGKSQIVTIDIDKNTYDITEYMLSDGEILSSSMIYIGSNQSHMIQNDRNQNQFMHRRFYDDKEKQYLELRGDQFCGMHGFGLIFDSKREEIVMFGGEYTTLQMTPNIGWVTEKWNGIRRYSLSTNEWKHCQNIQLPVGMSRFGCVITNDQRYIIILYGDPRRKRCDIYVWDLECMEIKKSKVWTPFADEMNAVIMEHKYENELLIHGFVRSKLKKYKMNIPFALMSLIGSFHVMEYVYVMNTFGYIKHFKINVDKIWASLHYI